MKRKERNVLWLAHELIPPNSFYEILRKFFFLMPR